MLPASKYKHHHVPEHPLPQKQQQQQKKKPLKTENVPSTVGWEAKLPKVKTQRKKKFF